MSRAAKPLPEGVQAHAHTERQLGLFHLLVGVLLLALVAGLAWQQLFRADVHHERLQRQGLRRVIVPGPRGRIFDREGRLLAGSRPRFAVSLALGDLGADFRAEYRVVRDNYRAAGQELPTKEQLEQIARTSVVQRQLDKLDAILGRRTQLDPGALQRHFSQQPVLPYLLLNDLATEEYARLVLERDLVPEWLRKSWESARQAGLDTLSMDEIDAEIAAARKARRESRLNPGA